MTNTVQLHRGSSVAVIGLGGVGLAALLGTRLSEASIVIACDLSEEKLALARSWARRTRSMPATRRH